MYLRGVKTLGGRLKLKIEILEELFYVLELREDVNEKTSDILLSVGHFEVI